MEIIEANPLEWEIDERYVMMEYPFANPGVFLTKCLLPESEQINVKLPNYYCGKRIVGIGFGLFQNKRYRYDSSNIFDYDPLENNTLQTIVIPDGYVYIDSFAFAGCTGLRRVNIPDSVKIICGGLLRGCNNLISVHLPAGCVYLGGESFKGCSKLEEIVIPNTIKEIQIETFAECSLKMLTLPNGITSIGRQAFANNPLKCITIPASVTSIGDNILQNSKPIVLCVPGSSAHMYAAINGLTAMNLSI